jgi:hypothetical protein
LAFWKYRGLGYLPAFSKVPAAGPAGAIAYPSLLGLHANIGHYLSINWAQLSHNLDGFREWTWSQRLVEWLAVGGLVGLARRSIPAAALVGVWLASFVVVKGSSTAVNFGWGSFLTHLTPALPAYFLLAVSTPFLVPIFGRRPVPPALRPGTRPTRPLMIAIFALAFASLLGALVVAVLPPLKGSAAADVSTQHLYLPMDGFALSAKPAGHTVRLSWASQAPSGTRVSYAIFRDPAGAVSCTPRRHAATQCTYPANAVGSTPGTRRSWLDHPPPGRWLYRVALNASPGPTQFRNDYILFSRPAAAVHMR